MQILSRRAETHSDSDVPCFVDSHVRTLLELETGQIDHAIGSVVQHLSDYYAGICMFQELAAGLNETNMESQMNLCKKKLYQLIKALSVPIDPRKGSPTAIQACKAFREACERPDLLGPLIPFPTKGGLLHGFNVPNSTSVVRNTEMSLNVFMGYASDWWFWDYEANSITLKLQDDILQKCFQLDDTLNEYRAILRDIEVSKDAFQESAKVEHTKEADMYTAIQRRIDDLPIQTEEWVGCFKIDQRMVNFSNILEKMCRLIPHPPSLLREQLHEINLRVQPGEAARQSLERMFRRIKADAMLQQIGETLYWPHGEGAKQVGLTQFKEEWQEVITLAETFDQHEKKAAIKLHEFDASKKLATERNRFKKGYESVTSKKKDTMRAIQKELQKLVQSTDTENWRIIEEVERKLASIIEAYDDLISDAEGFYKSANGVALIGAGQAGQQMLRATVLDALNNADNPRNRDFLIGIGITPHDLNRVRSIYRSYDYNILNLRPVFYDPTQPGTSKETKVYTYATSRGKTLETIDSLSVFNEYKDKMDETQRKDAKNFVELVDIFSKTSLLAVNLGHEIESLIKPDEQTALSFIWGRKIIDAKVVNGARHIATNLLLLIQQQKEKALAADLASVERLLFGMKPYSTTTSRVWQHITASVKS